MWYDYVMRRSLTMSTRGCLDMHVSTRSRQRAIPSETCPKVVHEDFLNLKITGGFLEDCVALRASVHLPTSIGSIELYNPYILDFRIFFGSIFMNRLRSDKK